MFKPVKLSEYSYKHHENLDLSLYRRLREQVPCENRLFQAICANQSPSVSRPTFSSGSDRVKRGSVPFWPHLDDNMRAD